jgi:hypothetical protein
MMSPRKGNRKITSLLREIAEIRQEEESSNATGDVVLKREKAMGVLESFRSSLFLYGV